MIWPRDLDIAAYVERAAVRFIADTLNEATAQSWERRAARFEWCRPRAGDYTGRATAAQIAAQDDRCRQIAEGCRRHAQMLREQNSAGVEFEVWEALQEVA